MDSHSPIIEQGYVVVSEGIISAIGEGTPPKKLNTSLQTIDCAGNILMPGFVNTHTHLPLTILRGSADDLPLEQWIQQKMGPLGQKCNYQTNYWGSLLGIAEMLRRGITAVNDMAQQIDAVLEAATVSGIRGIFSMGIETVHSNGIDDLEKTREMYLKYNGADNNRIQVGLGPHAEYTVTEDFMLAAKEMAQRLSCPIHMHISETSKEHQECKNRHNGKTPTRLCEDLGLFSLNMRMAHCVWVTDEDLDIIKEHHASVLHCPASNLKLASGIAPIRKMLDRGITVGIGTDSCVSNNKLDMWDEMRLASLLSKIETGYASSIPSWQALKLATLESAKAIGLQDVGAIQVGKKADIIVIDVSKKTHYTPKNDLFSHLVYSGNSDDVILTMVEGEILYYKGEYSTLNLAEIIAKNNELYKTVFE